MTPITLTAEQESAVAAAVAAVLDGRTHVIKGYAGTGKTTCLKEVVRRVQAAGRRIAMTAPTHKAVHVIRQVMQADDIYVYTGTTHALQGLRPSSDNEKRSLKRGGRSNVEAFNVVGIDECSMISKDHMKFIVADMIRNPKIGLLFIGDPAQLPPIGEAESESFRHGSVSELQTVMRQREDNPVLGLTMDIREMIDNEQPDWDRFRTEVAAESGIFDIRWTGDIMPWIRDAFTAQAAKDDPDLFRVITYTNAAADRYNKIIRQMIYGDVSMPFWPGETIVLKNPVVGEKGEVILSSNSEVVVESYESHTFEFNFEALAGEKYANGRDTQALEPWRHAIECWKVKVLFFDEPYEIITPKSEHAIKALTGKVRVEAGVNWKRWAQYYRHMDGLPLVTAPYAMTCHRAQGSTFGNVFLDLQDVQINRNVIEMLHLLYVAASRMRYALVLI